jgi:hypothetical protein
MEISAVEAESFFSDAPPTGDSIAEALERMSASFEERLNALAQGQGRVGGGAPRVDRIAGLKPEDIKKLQAEGKCFRCKKQGHMKNECPQKPKSKND